MTDDSIGLVAKLIARQSGAADVAAKLTVRHSGSADLAAEFRPAQDVADLLAGVVIRNKSSAGLKAALLVRHSSYVVLQSSFELAQWGELAAEFVIRRTVIQAPQLQAHLIVVRTYAELLEHLNVRHMTSLALQAHFTPRRSSADVLPAEFVTRRSAVENMPSELVVTRSASATLQCGLRVQHYADLQAHFEVIRIYTPEPIYGGNLKDWINFVQGLGSGFIMTPNLSNDPTQKVGGLNSLKLASIFSTGRYDGIRFGYHAYPSKPIPDYNFMNLPAKFYIEMPSVDLDAEFVPDYIPGFVATTTAPYPYQRRGFYCRGKSWVFYPNGHYIVFKTSIDGLNWSSETVAADLVSSTNARYEFSVWLDDNDDVHLVYSRDHDELVYVRGDPLYNGQILWDFSHYLNTSAGFLNAQYPHICVDSHGFPWITVYATNYSVSNRPFVLKSSTNDGTFIIDVGFPYQLPNYSPSGSLGFASLAAMDDHKMLVLYGTQNMNLRLIAWDGSAWLTDFSSGLGEIHLEYSAIGAGDSVHLAYLTIGDKIGYYRYDFVTNSLIDYHEVAPYPHLYPPNISVDPDTGDFYIFYFWYDNDESLGYTKHDYIDGWGVTSLYRRDFPESYHPYEVTTFPFIHMTLYKQPRGFLFIKDHLSLMFGRNPIG